MLRFLCWFLMLKFVVSSRIKLMTTEEIHISSCLSAIVQQYFTHDQPLLVCLPESESVHPVWMDVMLGQLNQVTLWPVYVSQGESEDGIVATLTTKPHSYIIFTGPQGEFGNVTETLVGQLDALQSSLSWNPRGRFVVLVTARDSRPSHLLALKISETLWNKAMIVNDVIMIPNSDALLIKDSANENVIKLDVYTWFPYQTGRCAEPLEVVLVGQCIEGNVNLSHSVSVFANRIPNNLQSCPLRVTARDYEPYVVLTSNDSGTDGSTTYKYRGINTEHVLLFSEVTNMTVQFLPPGEGTLLDAHVLQLADVVERSADVAAGRYFQSTGLSAFADPTIPFITDNVRWYVPCPRPAAKMEKVMGVFSFSSWLCMIVVFILISLVFWRSANGPDIPVAMGSRNLKTVLNCVYFVWCVCMSVSVSEMPRTWKLRTWFLLFVWYCFAMNTVFQAFFITFLVEPGYNKQIKTMEELNESHLTYCLDANSKEHHKQISYQVYENFDSLPINLGSLKECLEYYFINGNITLLSPALYARFVASLMGLDQNGNELFCTLDQDEYYIHAVLYLSPGHPLLDRFNTLIRRFAESGLVNKYWSQLNFEVYIRNVAVSRETECEACSDVYLVFSLYHLRVAFVVLGFGCVLSFTVFLGELIYKWYGRQRTVTT
ncbi:hypothetical protein L798_12871 [Zootermopsis nevadensis]|uniref:Ionotropic glutamate receptor C-terminal domain-containing protein n=1 Tax=Zootermopsis nevadensis TaxID=136037 RepID=A0A067QT80_ZOONE|nr:hypothetical protein L798_12871 [Zootermopsis nevadensis]